MGLGTWLKGDNARDVGDLLSSIWGELTSDIKRTDSESIETTGVPKNRQIITEGKVLSFCCLDTNLKLVNGNMIKHCKEQKNLDLTF